MYIIHVKQLTQEAFNNVPLVGYKRAKKNSDFWGSAAYGYCASKKLHYLGYKFVLLATSDGIPVAFEVVPANVDERDAAEEILPSANDGSVALGDKGFIDSQRQEEWKRDLGVSVYTFKRANQKVKNPPYIQQLLKKHRSQVETTLSSLKRVEELEHHNAKTVLGLITRVITKVTAYILRYLLRRVMALMFSISHYLRLLKNHRFSIKLKQGSFNFRHSDNNKTFHIKGNI
ncbi:IS982 family transposase [bacterium]|nr:IS982 family transposase [bacterium]